MNKISFSSLNSYNTCPKQYYISYILSKKEEVPKNNIFSTFGNSTHDGLESELTFKPFSFKDNLLNRLKNFSRLDKQILENKLKDKLTKTINELLSVGPELVSDGIKFLNQNYPNAKIIGVEKRLQTPFNDIAKFSGIIDLILKNEDRYLILDWKTTSWGWDAKKRSDKFTLYQPVYYKHFFAKEYNIDPSLVDTSFVLLKRGAKPGKRVEEIKFSSSTRRTKNALNILDNTSRDLFDRKKIFFKKVGQHCRMCSFNNTKFCPGKKG